MTPRPGGSSSGPAPMQETSAVTRAREIALVRSLAQLQDDDDINIDDEGWDSRVYIVNRGLIVFKFPRTSVARVAYANEIEIMRQLDGGDGVTLVPVVEWVGPEHSYLGYRGIVGRQLGRIASALPDADRIRIGHDLGQFLTVLHGVEFDGLPTRTVADEIAEFTRKFTASQDAIAAEFTGSEMARLDEFFSARLPERMHGLGSEPRVCHGDLGLFNMVLGDDGRIGVIDFGDVSVVDQAKDFMGLDGVMLTAALETYGGSERLRAKVDIRTRALPALDLPFYLGKGDAAGVANCVARLRATVIDGAG